LPPRGLIEIDPPRFSSSRPIPLGQESVDVLENHLSTSPPAELSTSRFAELHHEIGHEEPKQRRL